MLVITSAEGVAAITVGGALIVAGITARTTNRRQREALVHDRGLADLDDLRRLLDEAAIALDRARDAHELLDVRLIEWGVALPDEPRDKVEKHGRALVALNARLRVRLGADNPIAAHFDAASEAIHETWQQVHRLEDDTAESFQAKRAVVGSQGVIFTEEVSAFFEAAVERAGTVPLKGGVPEPSEAEQR